MRGRENAVQGFFAFCSLRQCSIRRVVKAREGKNERERERERERQRERERPGLPVWPVVRDRWWAGEAMQRFEEAQLLSLGIINSLSPLHLLRPPRDLDSST